MLDVTTGVAIVFTVIVLIVAWRDHRQMREVE